MINAPRICTFCSCDEPAEFLLTGRREPIPLCSHHAALVGAGQDEALTPIHSEAPAPPAQIDQRRLVVAAVAARA